jgi:sialate O-acetylesterase
MIIQRDMPFIVKGTANANEDIVVRFNKKSIKTKANYNGKWEVCFDTIRVDGKKHKLTITSKNKSLSFKNILVGEVILCSGNCKPTYDNQHTTDFVKNHNDDIRIYYMETPAVTKVVSDLENMNSIEEEIINDCYLYWPTIWQTINEDNIDYYKSSYHLARKISDSLQMPVGLIYNIVEDMPIESFIDRKTLEWHPTLLNILYEWRNKDKIMDYCHPYEPSYIYHRGFAPLSSFTIGSAIWFMKHSDDDIESIKISALIDSWRKTWNNEELPFYIQ